MAPDKQHTIAKVDKQVELMNKCMLIHGAEVAAVLTWKRVCSMANLWKLSMAPRTFLWPPGTRQRAPRISRANRGEEGEGRGKEGEEGEEEGEAQE